MSYKSRKSNHISRVVIELRKSNHTPSAVIELRKINAQLRKDITHKMNEAKELLSIHLTQ